MWDRHPTNLKEMLEENRQII